MCKQYHQAFLIPSISLIKMTACMQIYCLFPHLSDFSKNITNHRHILRGISMIFSSWVGWSREVLVCKCWLSCSNEEDTDMWSCSQIETETNVLIISDDDDDDNWPCSYCQQHTLLSEHRSNHTETCRLIQAQVEVEHSADHWSSLCTSQERGTPPHHHSQQQEQVWGWHAWRFCWSWRCS